MSFIMHFNFLMSVLVAAYTINNLDLEVNISFEHEDLEVIKEASTTKGFFLEFYFKDKDTKF